LLLTFYFYFYFYLFTLGLAIRVKLLRSLPPRFKVDVRIRPGTHASELAVNKQAAQDGHFFENTVGLLKTILAR
jgi:hypothetical protein